jgi:hypothetical protein
MYRTSDTDGAAGQTRRACVLEESVGAVVRRGPTPHGHPFDVVVKLAQGRTDRAQHVAVVSGQRLHRRDRAGRRIVALQGAFAGRRLLAAIVLLLAVGSGMRRGVPGLMPMGVSVFMLVRLVRQMDAVVTPMSMRRWGVVGRRRMMRVTCRGRAMGVMDLGV